MARPRSLNMWPAACIGKFLKARTSICMCSASMVRVSLQIKPTLPSVKTLSLFDLCSWPTTTGVSVMPGRANTIVGRLTEECQTVHMKELTDLPKNDQEDPTEVFTDIHFEKKSVAHEAYHLSHGFYH